MELASIGANDKVTRKDTLLSTGARSVAPVATRPHAATLEVFLVNFSHALEIRIFSHRLGRGAWAVIYSGLLVRVLR